MAASTTKAVFHDRRDGGFYKCEECAKAFNRMASYEAHIRMHAQDELDVLDLVFNYSQKMHESAVTGEQRKRSQNGRNQRRKSSTTTARLSPSPPLQDKRVCVAGKPCTSMASKETAIRVVDRAVDGRESDSNTVSSTTATNASLSSPTPSTSRSEVGVSPVAARVNTIPSQMIGLNKTGQANTLPLKIPLKYCSGSLMRGPTINLTKQSSDSCTLTQLLKSKPLQRVEKALSDDSLDTGSTTDREEGDNHEEESAIDSELRTKTPPKCRVIRLDSLGLPQEPDDPDKTTSPVESHSQIKKRRMTPLTDRHRCRVCGRCLSSNASLKRHQLLHTGERPFKCSVCTKSFTQAHHRLNHELSHWAVIQLPDNDTRSTSSSSPHDKERESMSSFESRTPHENRVLKCKVCKKLYRNIRSLREHIMTHDMRRKYQCPVCPMKFAQPAHCFSHMQVHSNLTQFSCPECNEEFTEFEEFEDHLKSHRFHQAPLPEPEIFKYVCRYCPKICRSISGLKRHVYTHQTATKNPSSLRNGEASNDLRENDTDSVVVGEKSAKKVTKGEEEQLSNESAFLSGELEFELDSEASDSDGEMRSTGSGMVGSRVVGSGELLDKDVCEESPIENGMQCEEEREDDKLEEEDEGDSSEEEHTMSPLRLETDEDSCEENQEEIETEEDNNKKNTLHNQKKFRKMCGMPYRNIHNHKKSRSGKVPQYKCEWCGRMFLRHYYLIQHYALHQQIPHQCPLCDKVFMSPRYLRRHLNTAHTNQIY